MSRRLGRSIGDVKTWLSKGDNLAKVALVVFVVAFLQSQAEHRFAKTTSDSDSYLRTALHYEQTGEYRVTHWRERGYPALVWGIAAITPGLGKESLIRWVTGIQLVLFLGLAAALLLLTYRLSGPWLSAMLAAGFWADRFNGGWIVSVMSEAPATLLAMAAAVVGFWALRRNQRGIGHQPMVIGTAALLMGMIPLMRSADLALALVAAGGVILWALLEPRPRRLMTAGAIAGLLIAPSFIFAQALYWNTGFFGLSERGTNHVAARFITVADPDKVAAVGAPPDIVNEIIRPVHEEWHHLAGRRGMIREGSSAVFYPVTRLRSELERGKTPLAARTNLYLQKRQRPHDHYAVAALEAELARYALAGDPKPVLQSILNIAWDYARLPWTEKNFWGEAEKRVYLWPAIWLWLIVCFARTRSKPAFSIALFVSALCLLPAYWILISMGSSYNPRYSTHLYLPFTLWLMLAVASTGAVVSRSIPPGQGRKARSG